MSPLLIVYVTQAICIENWSQEFDSSRIRVNPYALIILSNARHSRTRTHHQNFVCFQFSSKNTAQHSTALVASSCVTTNIVSNRRDNMFYANCPNFQCRSFSLSLTGVTCRRLNLLCALHTSQIQYIPVNSSRLNKRAKEKNTEKLIRYKTEFMHNGHLPYGVSLVLLLL